MRVDPFGLRKALQQASQKLSNCRAPTVDISKTVDLQLEIVTSWVSTVQQFYSWLDS